MTIRRVAIPVLRGKRRFHILQGRPWSPVEHLILKALAAKPYTSSELIAASNLPFRVVMEVLIRLMRAGWVEMFPTASGTNFKATSEGSDKANYEELPSFPKSLKKTMTFVIDKITGTTFRGREMPIYEEHVLRERFGHDQIVWVKPYLKDVTEQPNAIFSALTNEDETVSDVDAHGDRLVDRYALLLVRNGKVEGLSPRAPEVLRQAVSEAVREAGEQKSNTSFDYYVPAGLIESHRHVPVVRPISFQTSDMVLGADAHKHCLETAISRARRRLVIHSTFVRQQAFASLLPKLISKAKEGVLIDVLWGEGDDKGEITETRSAVEWGRQNVSQLNLDSSLRIHPFSTSSHAKIILSDEGGSNYVGVIGSCNWLYSGFDSYEASIRLRDAAIVSDVVEVLVELSRGRAGLWKPLTTELAVLAQELRRRPAGAGRAEAALVLGPAHGDYVRKARDEVQRRLFVASHRMGAAAQRSILTPSVAATTSKSRVSASIYYGRVTDTLTAQKASDMTFEVGRAGVRVKPTVQPRLHAKVLAWDDDNIVVSSQNWLSADPTHRNVPDEVGVYIRSARAADHLIRNFDLATW